MKLEQFKKITKTDISIYTFDKLKTNINNGNIKVPIITPDELGENIDNHNIYDLKLIMIQTNNIIHRAMHIVFIALLKDRTNCIFAIAL